jgi:cytochrome P450
VTASGSAGPAYAPAWPVSTVDFSDPDTFLNGHPFDAFRRLRQASPVFWNPEPAPGRGFWGLTRYADVLEVSNNPEVFCNRYGYKSVDDTYFRIGDHVGAAMSRILPAIDPPEHTLVRHVFTSYFSPRVIRELEESTRAKACRIVGRLDGAETIEAVSELAVHLPIEVLADLMGVPEEDRHKLLYWTDGIFGADDPDYFRQPQDALGRFVEMFEYGRAMVNERRGHPTGDLLSAVANARVDGEYLDREQVDGVLAMFIGAGNETSRNSITGSLLALWEHPDARQRLLDDPALIGPATDELLRYVTPAIHMRRTATRDAEIGGQRIAQGEKVVMFYAAANRDPAMFPDPDRLDVTRENAKRHLSFGIGIHRCIGALLAKMELRVFLEEFLPRFPAYEVASQPSILRHNFVHAIKSLNVHLGPRATGRPDHGRP